MLTKQHAPKALKESWRGAYSPPIPVTLQHPSTTPPKQCPPPEKGSTGRTGGRLGDTVCCSRVGQSEGHVSRRYDGILGHMQGPHQVVDVDKGVELGHSLWRDELAGDPHDSAGDTQQPLHLLQPGW